ncbi:MAG TPA: endonuclease III [Acidimicrobiales bacterium]|nr:endonuclease III [Acidimicrobiales bacterium]
MAGSKSLRRRAGAVVERLATQYPGSAAELCALRHDGPFQLLAATILSAQCTDERVNMVTPALFEAYPTAEALSSASPADVEQIIRSTGFFRSKARSLVGMAGAVVDRFDGEVPSDMEALTTLPGVGRKTANVLRSVALGLPGLPVDTHVGRLARRLGLSDHHDPVKVESDLGALVAPEEGGALSLRLILHGRAVCKARKPLCEGCVLLDLCPSAELPVRASGPTTTTRSVRTRRRTAS